MAAILLPEKSSHKLGHFPQLCLCLLQKIENKKIKKNKSFLSSIKELVRQAKKEVE